MNPALRSFAAQWQTRSADALSPVRAQAMERFLKLGLPTTRDETWRYTNLRSLAAQSFVDAPRKTRGEIEPNASLSLLDKTDRAASLLMVNGYPTMPVVDGLISGMEIYSLREVARLDPNTLLRFLEPLSDADQRRWALLNTALFVDGLYLKITPAYRCRWSSCMWPPATAPTTLPTRASSSRRTPGSSATIIEHHVAQGDHTRFATPTRTSRFGTTPGSEHYRVFAPAPTPPTSIRWISARIRTVTASSSRSCWAAACAPALEAPPGQAGRLARQPFAAGGTRRPACRLRQYRAHGAPDTRSDQRARAIASDSSRVISTAK